MCHESSLKLTFSFLLASLTSTLVPAAAAMSAGGGAPDLTFGTAGQALVDNLSYRVLTQADGKLLVIQLDGRVTRLLPDGSVDATYGTAGTAQIPGPVASQITISAGALQPDGKLVLAGGRSDFGTFSPALVRFGPDGAIDAGFGFGGVIDYFSPDAPVFYDVAVHGDGLLALAQTSGIPSEAVLFRVLDNGFEDQSFGTSGVKVIATQPTYEVFPLSLVTLPDGRIQIDGEFIGPLPFQVFQGVMRLTADGELDTTFDQDGVAAAPFVEAFGQFDFLVDSSGRTVLVAAASASYQVARLLPDGSPDTSFGTGGVVFGPGSPAVVDSLALAPGGELYIGSTLSTLSTHVTRLNSDGSFDPLFGQNGVVTLGTTPSSEVGGIALLGDGTVAVHVQAQGGARSVMRLYDRAQVQGVQDFEGAGGLAFTTNGTASVSAGSVQLTPVLQGQLGSAVSDVLAPAAVDELVASFDFYMGGGNGADGISFNLLDDSVHGAGSLFGESGPAVGALTLGLKRYANGGFNEANVRLDGQLLSAVPVGFTLDSSEWHRADVVLSGGLLSVTLTSAGGTVETPFVDFALPGFTPFVARAGFGGRTGTDTNEHRVDNFQMMLPNQLVPSLWTELGNGLAGTHGVPRLAGSGCLVPGTPYSIVLSNALQASPTFQVFGLFQVDSPLLGGILVPSPEIILNAGTSPAGGYDLSGTWPNFPGLVLFTQAWTIDPAAPEFVSASNGLRLVAP